MTTPIQVLLAVADIGGQLGIAGDGKLRMLLPADSPPELKAAIRQHKPGLLELLRLNFLAVQSDALNATLLWTPDDATKEALMAAGAGAGRIYTASELAQLADGRVTASELPTIHAAKERFHGWICEPQ